MQVWKSIPEFEGLYEVSDDGHVRSLDKVVEGVWGKSKKVQSRLHKGKVLKPYENHARGGYRYVNLRKNGKQHMRRVARLVASAFLGPCPEGFVVCHNNGISNDDNLANLRYDTHKSNAADKYLHGTHAFGENAVQSILTEEQVRRIKYGGENRNSLAEELGIHVNHISNIRSGLRWSHV